MHSLASRSATRFSRLSIFFPPFRFLTVHRHGQNLAVLPVNGEFEMLLPVRFHRTRIDTQVLQTDGSIFALASGGIIDPPAIAAGNNSCCSPLSFRPSWFRLPALLPLQVLRQLHQIAPALDDRHVDMQERSVVLNQLQPVAVVPCRRVRVLPKRLHGAKTPWAPRLDRSVLDSPRAVFVAAVDVAEYHVVAVPLDHLRRRVFRRGMPVREVAVAELDRRRNWQAHVELALLIEADATLFQIELRFRAELTQKKRRVGSVSQRLGYAESL